MIKTSILASGSKGNALYFEANSSAVLIDNGLSLKKLENQLMTIGRTTEDISAVIVSHEHSDHIKGVELLARKRKIPVYITKKTFSETSSLDREKHEIHFFNCGDTLSFQGLFIETFPTEHDAVDSSGFILKSDGYSIGLATDMGKVTNIVKYKLSKVNHLMIEANHEPDILMSGPYPWHLKKRIKGEKGHLSNQDCFLLLDEVFHEDVSHVSFLHLSEENNNPDILRAMALERLAKYNVNFTIGNQNYPSKLI